MCAALVRSGLGVRRIRTYGRQDGLRTSPQQPNRPGFPLYRSGGSNVVTRLLLADRAQNVVIAALPVFEKARERGSELSWEQACPDELLIELPNRLSMTRVAVSVGQVKRADSMKRSVVGSRYGIIPGSFAQENLRDA